jgi:phage portal protein BeeE
VNPIQRFLNVMRPKASLKDDLANGTLMGWHPTGVNTLDYYKDNQYENGYGSITKIVNAFVDVLPYTVDKNAKKVPSNLINRLYHPNQDMSSSDFRESLAVMALIHDRVFVLVWRSEGGVARPGGVITPENIAGFTFLENPVVTLVDGRKVYTVDGKTYSESEVIELKDINPYNLHRGYSPARAAEKWATIDDYIAAYQKGFFKNGAVPAGQFIITASTPQEFNDEVDKLEAKHKGAGKNNNIVYVHRPMDREGKPSNAKIEWVPFNVQNKDLALNDIFEQANLKIDSVYGVPAEIRGHLSNSNYASVNVAEKIFIKYVVMPFTQKLWTRFTHQLNRITGGLDVAISFELDIPGLVDEELIIEQTKKHRDERVQLYIERGYTLTSIKKYLETDDLTMLEATTEIAEEGNDDVDEGDEVTDAPDVPDGSGTGAQNKLEYERHCSSCDRFLGLTTNKDYADKDKCSNTACKALEVPVIKEAK